MLLLGVLTCKSHHFIYFDTRLKSIKDNMLSCVSNGSLVLSDSHIIYITKLQNPYQLEDNIQLLMTVNCCLIIR